MGIFLPKIKRDLTIKECVRTQSGGQYSYYR